MPNYTDPDAARTTRRTSIITIGPDTLRLCEPECRNEFLLDLGIPARSGGWAYPPRGTADVHIAWNSHDHTVTWKRCRPSALQCDLCENAWQHRIPALIAQAAARSAAMKGHQPPHNFATGVTAQKTAQTANQNTPAAPASQTTPQTATRQTTAPQTAVAKPSQGSPAHTRKHNKFAS